MVASAGPGSGTSIPLWRPPSSADSHELDVHVDVLHERHQIQGNPSVLQCGEGVRLVEVMRPWAATLPPEVPLADVQPCAALLLLTLSVLPRAVVVGVAHLNRHRSQGLKREPLG